MYSQNTLSPALVCVCVWVSVSFGSIFICAPKSIRFYKLRLLKVKNTFPPSKGFPESCFSSLVWLQLMHMNEVVWPLTWPITKIEAIGQNKMSWKRSWAKDKSAAPKKNPRQFALKSNNSSVMENQNPDAGLAIKLYKKRKVSWQLKFLT